MIKTKMKRNLLFFAMGVMMIFPANLSAQRRGGTDAFFEQSGYSFDDRDNSLSLLFFSNQTFGATNDWGITNETFGSNAPLGSGLLIMLTAGAGYVLKKKLK